MSDQNKLYTMNLEEKLKLKDIQYKELRAAYLNLSNDIQRMQQQLENSNRLIDELSRDLNKEKQKVYQELTPEREKVLLKEIKNIQRSNMKKNRLIEGYKYLLTEQLKSFLDKIELETLKENEYEN